MVWSGTFTTHCTHAIGERDYAKTELCILQLAGLRLVDELHGLYSCSLYYIQLVALRVVGLHIVYINNLYCNHHVLASAFWNSSIIFCRTLVGSLPLANNGQHSASTYIPQSNSNRAMHAIIIPHRRRVRAWQS